jgi:FAD-dependent urate hydroxylase
VTLLGDAAHTMAPTLAQGTNQALLDAMVLRKALSGVRKDNGDIATALRWYENTRRRKVKAVSWVTTQQVSRSEAVLRPAALISDRLTTWALTRFLGWVSHRDISAEISQASLAEVR